MKALTLHQPWAELVRLGVKWVETRGWPTRYRGPVLIHAGAKQPPSWVGPVGDYQLRPVGRCGWVLLGPGLPEYRSTPRLQGHGVPWGKVVAVADLYDCVPMVTPAQTSDWVLAELGTGQPLERRYVVNTTESHGGSLRLIHQVPDSAGVSSYVTDLAAQEPYGDFRPGRWAWLLRDVQALPEPVPAVGRQRLWTPGVGLVAAVFDQLHPSGVAPPGGSALR